MNRISPTRTNPWFKSFYPKSRQKGFWFELELLWFESNLQNSRFCIFFIVFPVQSKGNTYNTNSKGINMLGKVINQTYNQLLMYFSKNHLITIYHIHRWISHIMNKTQIPICKYTLGHIWTIESRRMTYFMVLLTTLMQTCNSQKFSLRS